MKEKHIEESARAPEEWIQVKDELILLISRSSLSYNYALFVFPKKIWKTENSVSVLQLSVMFAQSYILSISKAKNRSFPFLRKKRHCSFKNFNFTSPFENTYHLPCKIQPFPLPLPFVTLRCLRDRCRNLITQYTVLSAGRLAKWLHYLWFSITNALCSEMKVNSSTFD